MILRRTGHPPAVHRMPDESWRAWTFRACEDMPPLGKVDIELIPLARDARTRFVATSFYATADLVIDGLIAAKVVADRRDIASLTFRPSIVSGVDGLEIVVLPTERKSTDDPQRHLTAVA